MNTYERSRFQEERALLISFPEKLRKTLERLVNSLKTKENVYGIGLFGSWSRGEAETSSDVDLFILDKSNISRKYVERVVAGGFLVDLDYVPKTWLEGPIPPEIDQKLYEMQVLYDRDWSLANTKLLVARVYGSAERVDIRTEVHVIDSDVYLSRATSALAREDFRSAQLFAVMALESILKVPAEVALLPFSNSHFVERLEASLAKVGFSELFKEYLEISSLGKADKSLVKEKLELFKAVWHEINFATNQSSQAFASAHFVIRKRLSYYLNPAFLQGALSRAGALADSGKAWETSHYLKAILVDIVEGYVWLKALTGRSRLDYARLMHALERLERKNPKNYENIVEFLDLGDVNKANVEKTVVRVRETILRVRRERKVLIKNHIIGDGNVISRT